MAAMSELPKCKLCGVVPMHRADGLIAHGTWNSECPLWESAWMTPEQWVKLMGQGEPVAWKYTTNGANVWFSAVKPPDDAYDAGTLIPLYAAPPQAQGDDVLRDAMRYRWLRQQRWDSSRLCVVTDPKRSVRLGQYCPTGDLLDEEIDAAMK